MYHFYKWTICYSWRIDLILITTDAFTYIMHKQTLITDHEINSWYEILCILVVYRSILPGTTVIFITTIVKIAPTNAPVIDYIPSVILLFPIRNLPETWAPLNSKHSAMHWICILSFFHLTYRWYPAKRALPIFIDRCRHLAYANNWLPHIYDFP